MESFTKDMLESISENRYREIITESGRNIYSIIYYIIKSLPGSLFGISQTPHTIHFNFEKNKFRCKTLFGDTDWNIYEDLVSKLIEINNVHDFKGFDKQDKHLSFPYEKVKYFMEMWNTYKWLSKEKFEKFKYTFCEVKPEFFPLICNNFHCDFSYPEFSSLIATPQGFQKIPDDIRYFLVFQMFMNNAYIRFHVASYYEKLFDNSFVIYPSTDTTFNIEYGKVKRVIFGGGMPTNLIETVFTRENSRVIYYWVDLFMQDMKSLLDAFPKEKDYKQEILNFLPSPISEFFYLNEYNVTSNVISNRVKYCVLKFCIEGVTYVLWRELKEGRKGYRTAIWRESSDGEFVYNNKKLTFGEALELCKNPDNIHEKYFSSLLTAQK
jgi:hypothetical protein